jgi:hypothetical protein
MAKKSRRTRTATRVSAAPQNNESKQAPAQSQSAVQKNARQPVVAAVNVMQAGHYDYVKDDLIRIGIISAVLILILVVLTFIPALKT